ncbi:MAG: protease modulator HflC [Candidatus Omnitrophica bacterium]|nr:protease modulator HflC [Candidatus Omnitrophota bacterium]
MSRILYLIAAIFIIVILFFMSGALYIVDETQQVVITQFGKPIGKPITEAGLHFKTPFIRQANYFDKRILQWDGKPNQIPTKDKKYIWVDTTARWRINDPLKFLQSVTSEVGAHARLDDIIDSATRDYITNEYLVEVVRNSNRLMDEMALEDEDLDDTHISMDEKLEKIDVGRENITRGILENASKMMPQYGIELIDVRIKRINYVKEVQRKVFERMISERKRAAEKYRSEGQGKKAEVEGRMEKELNQIRSEAYKVAEELKGNADAEAIGIYADAYNRDPEFYSFVKTLDTYRNTIDKDTNIILSTDSEYFEYLRDTKPRQ